MVPIYEDKQAEEERKEEETEPDQIGEKVAGQQRGSKGVASPLALPQA